MGNSSPCASKDTVSKLFYWLARFLCYTSKGSRRGVQEFVFTLLDVASSPWQGEILFKQRNFCFCLSLLVLLIAFTKLGRHIISVHRRRKMSWYYSCGKSNWCGRRRRMLSNFQCSLVVYEPYIFWSMLDVPGLLRSTPVLLCIKCSNVQLAPVPEVR